MIIWRFIYWAVVVLFIMATMLAVIISIAVIFWVALKILSWWMEKKG